MPGIRGKFKINEITRYDWARRSAYIKLESVDEEGKQPFAASMSMMVTDPAVIDCFPLGDEMYITFTRANKT